MFYLEVFTGPMGSGKTNRMLTELQKMANVTKRPTALISPKLTRFGSDGITSHTCQGEVSVSPNIDKYFVENIAEVDLDKYVYVGIDEAQFFNDLEETIDRHKLGDKSFYVSGLTHDSDNNVWGQIQSLFKLSTRFHKYSSYCTLCAPELIPANYTFANFDKREVVHVGGMESYIPLCTNHYNMKMGFV